MNFLLKRYIHGIRRRRNWLMLVLVFPCLYLAFSSVRADRFTVTQTLSISPNAPVALISSPVGYRTLSDVIDSPDSFFQNSYTVTRLLQETSGSAATDWSGQQASEFISSLRNNMTLSVSDEGLSLISYYGSSRETGEILVGFYSGRLVRQTLEGYTRSNTTAPVTPALSGSADITGHRAFWRNDRITPVIQITILSCLGVLVLLGAFEWSDTSFKSERQIGRYLDLPVLGSVPDLNKLSDRIRKQPVTAPSDQPHPV